MKTPTRSFQWMTQIWFPSNWIVRRSFQGQSEIIPTVQSATATSITTPRSDPSQVCKFINIINNRVYCYLTSHLQN